MAWPFGPAISLSMYIDWAKKAHGFKAQSGVRSDKSGQVHTFVKIFKDGGPEFFAIGLSQSAPLYPYQIENMNRVLGISYPWDTK
jgi:hypothetical protein